MTEVNGLITPGEDEVLILFARHGETDWNKHRRIQGRGKNPPLNETGIAQAEVLAGELKDYTFAKIYASTRERAIQTAKAVRAHHKDTPYEEIDGFDEVGFGEAEGHMRADIQVQIDAVYRKWWAGDREARYPGGESPNDVIVRGMSALRQIVEGVEPGKTLLVASHGLIRRFLQVEITQGGDFSKMKNIPYAENCSYVNWRYNVKNGVFTEDETGLEGFGDLGGEKNSRI